MDTLSPVTWLSQLSSLSLLPCIKLTYWSDGISYDCPDMLPFIGGCGHPGSAVFSLSAFQNPVHLSKSNSHINASLILAPEIDLCFSLQLCYHFTCPSWPLSNSPCTINIYGEAFPPPYCIVTVCGTELSCASGSSSQNLK